MASPKETATLKSVGEGIRRARLLRRMTAADLAARAMTSPKTIQRLEKGDPGVAIGVFASVMLVLGLIGEFERLLKPENDDIGMMLGIQDIPKRGRGKKTVHKSDNQKKNDGNNLGGVRGSSKPSAEEGW